MNSPTYKWIKIEKLQSINPGLQHDGYKTEGVFVFPPLEIGQSVRILRYEGGKPKMYITTQIINLTPTTFQTINSIYKYTITEKEYENL